MKAEQRKQLEQNELLARLTRWWKGDAGSKSSTTMWAIVGVVALIALLIFAWRYYSDSAMKTRSAQWGDLQLAFETSQLEQIAEANRGTATGRAAKAQLARGWLQDGLSKLGSELFRSAAVESVEKARKAYDELLKESLDDPQLERESLLALAKAEESLVGIPKKDSATEERGNLDKALEHYKQLADKHKDSLQGKIAAERVADIEKNKAAILTFYKELNASFVRKEIPKAPELSPIFPPKSEAPPFPPPSITPPPIEGPKIEAPKSDPKKTEPPKVEAPKTSDPKKTEPPKSEAKKEEPKVPVAPPPSPKNEPKKEEPKSEPKKDGKTSEPAKTDKK